MRIPTPAVLFPLKLQCFILWFNPNSNNGSDNAVFRQKTSAIEGRGIINQVAGVEGSNPQPPVLETGALPIELHSCGLGINHYLTISSFVASFLFDDRGDDTGTNSAATLAYCKTQPSSIAIGAISVTVIAILSPGITISVPSGSTTDPVTSVVRK